MKMEDIVAQFLESFNTKDFTNCRLLLTHIEEKLLVEKAQAESLVVEKEAPTELEYIVLPDGTSCHVDLLSSSLSPDQFEICYLLQQSINRAGEAGILISTYSLKTTELNTRSIDLLGNIRAEIRLAVMDLKQAFGNMSQQPPLKLVSTQPNPSSQKRKFDDLEE